MSQLENGGAYPSSSGRNTAPPVRLPGVQESLATPGRVPARPNLQAANEADELARLWGYTGRAAAQAVHEIANLTGEARQKRDAMERGQANGDWQTDLAVLQDQIAQRQLLVPDGMDVKEFARQMVEQKVDGRSDAYAQAYRQITPHLAQAFVHQQRGIQNEVIGHIVQTTGESIAIASTPEQINRELSDLSVIAPNLTEDEKMGLVLKAAQAHAVNGPKYANQLEAAMTVLGDRFPTEQKAVRATFAEATAREHAAEEARALEDFSALRRSGAPVNQLREAVAADKRLDERSKGELDRTINSLEEDTLRVAHGQFVNSLKVRARRSDITPDEIRSYESSGRISADDAQAVEGMLKKTERTDIDSHIVASMLSGRGPSVPVPTNLDNGLMKHMADLGIASAPVDANGNYHFAAVAEPELFAAMSVKAQRVLPGAAEQTAQSFDAARTADQIQTAARTYAAVAIDNPLLAESIRQQMGPTGRLRADYVMGLLRANPVRVSPLTADASGRTAANPDYVARVNAAVSDPQLFSLKPIDLTPEQSQATLWNNGRAGGDRANMKQAARKAIETALPAGLDNTRFTFGFGRDVSIAEPLVNEYMRAAEAEVKTALSLGMNDADAVKRAQANAAQAVLATHPPILWNGVVNVGPQAPYPFTKELGTQMRADLAAAIKDKKLSQTESFYLNSTVPSWLPNVNVADPTGAVHLGAWTLMDPSGLPLRLADGKEFLFIPAVANQPTVRQMREKAEAEGRAAVKAKDDLARQYGGSLDPGVP